MIKLHYLALGLMAATLVTGTPAAAGDGVQGASSLADLPHKPLGDRVPVTIYRFRSTLNWVDPDAATDMFTAALVKSGQFRVVERQNLQPDIAVEHSLNANGQSTGDAGQTKLTGAKYIFEGVVSEGGQQTKTQSGGVTVAGVTVGKGKTSGLVTIDVRIVDAGTGDVLDAVTVSEKLGTKKTSMQGLGNLIGTVTQGKLGAFTPNVDAQSGKDDSYSQALRAAMEDSVLALVKDIG